MTDPGTQPTPERERPDWLTKQFEDSTRRSGELPPHARPIVPRPGPAVQPQPRSEIRPLDVQHFISAWESIPARFRCCETCNAVLAALPALLAELVSVRAELDGARAWNEQENDRHRREIDALDDKRIAARAERDALRRQVEELLNDNVSLTNALRDVVERADRADLDDPVMRTTARLVSEPARTALAAPPTSSTPKEPSAVGDESTEGQQTDDGRTQQ